MITLFWTQGSVSRRNKLLIINKTEFEQRFFRYRKITVGEFSKLIAYKAATMAERHSASISPSGVLVTHALRAAWAF